MQQLRLKEREERRLLRGHLWVYRNELQNLPEIEDGELVDVVASQGRFVGRGFFESQGGIAARLLTRHQETIDPSFWQRRIEAALDYRHRIYPGQNVYRLVFGESDGLPGLVLDRYGPVISGHTACAFYGRHAELLSAACLQLDGITGFRFEGSSGVQWFGEACPQLELDTAGIRLGIDLDKAQKTGLFLDQRENRRRVRLFADGATVLDGHCYVGAWSIHAALAGAAEVRGVDRSEPALEQARYNAELNGVNSTCTFENADIGEVLQEERSYDMVILDPPALAKRRRDAGRALGLYHALNRDALAALNPGGWLFTSSCSHFVGREDFLEMLKRASTSARRRTVLVELNGAAPDHPVLMAMPETAYLKCAVLRVE